MKKEQMNKILRVLLGSFIMGIGITLTIRANVGSDPMTLFWIGTAQHLSISVGQANLLICGIILILVFFIDKKQIHIGSLLNPIVIALTTDALTRIPFTMDSFLLRSLICVLGLAVLAFGIALYALADYGKGAYEALVFTLSNISKISIGVIRTLCDISFALIGMALGGPAAFGTVLAIICMGVGIQFFIKKLSRTII